MFSKGLFPRGIKRCHCVGMGSLINCMVFNAVFKIISVILWQPVHLYMLSLRYFDQYQHTILSKPLAAYLHNCCPNNIEWWERNESHCNDYHQSLERILDEPRIKPAASCFQVLLLTELCGLKLTLSQTSPGFYVSAVQVFWKHCGKRRNCS